MATSSTYVFRDKKVFIADVTATADADATINVNHDLGDVPEEVVITPLLQAPAAVSLWAVTTIDRTKVTLTKGTGAGSGNAGKQIRVTVRRQRRD